jgi:hypothetical protein
VISRCEIELICLSHDCGGPERKELSVVIRETAAPWLIISYLIA